MLLAMDFPTSQDCYLSHLARLLAYGVFSLQIYQKNWDQVGILNNYFHTICYISFCSLHARILVVILIDTYEN